MSLPQNIRRLRALPSSSGCAFRSVRESALCGHLDSADAAVRCGVVATVHPYYGQERKIEAGTARVYFLWRCNTVSIAMRELTAFCTLQDCSGSIWPSGPGVGVAALPQL